MLASVRTLLVGSAFANTHARRHTHTDTRVRACVRACMSNTYVSYLILCIGIAQDCMEPYQCHDTWVEWLRFSNYSVNDLKCFLLKLLYCICVIYATTHNKTAYIFIMCNVYIHFTYKALSISHLNIHPTMKNSCG